MRDKGLGFSFGLVRSSRTGTRSFAWDNWCSSVSHTAMVDARTRRKSPSYEVLSKKYTDIKEIVMLSKRSIKNLELKVGRVTQETIDDQLNILLDLGKPRFKDKL